MMTKISKLRSLALASLALLCLGSSVMAGPGPMYMMINGKMMSVTPLTKDVTLKNGCKVCVNGAVITPKGKTTKVAEGQMVNAEGKVMTPAATHAHGG